MRLFLCVGLTLAQPLQLQLERLPSALEVLPPDRPARLFLLELDLEVRKVALLRAQLPAQRSHRLLQLLAGALAGRGRQRELRVGLLELDHCVTLLLELVVELPELLLEARGLFRGRLGSRN
uniref:Putative secreted protein n=1 Tax=Ixodes ricinus TaxID=34613 RepID=A0A6B0UNS5_IXORI